MAWCSTLPRTAGLALLAISLLAAAPAAKAQTEPKYEWFPVGGGFRSPVADPDEPRVAVSRLKVRHDAGEFSAARAAIGYDFGLLRREGTRADDGWRLGLFGSIDSLFNLDLPGDALVNTDYQIGLPLSWRSGGFSARARLYHQSSHLGDELILGGNAPRRINLSFEAADLLLAWQLGNWRVYGGGGYAFSSSTPLYEGGSAQLGFDFVGTRSLLGMRPTLGLDAKWLERDGHWRHGVTAKIGAMVGRFSPDRRGITLFFEAHDGVSPFGQFFVEDMHYKAVTLQFDF